MPDSMSKYRLSEIANGGHFFVHDPEGGDLARIEAKLKELKDKVCVLLMLGIGFGMCVILVRVRVRVLVRRGRLRISFIKVRSVLSTAFLS